MNGFQRIEAALRGKEPDTVPVMLHNFMLAAREAGLTMEQFRSDPKQMARAFTESVERYEFDGIMVDVDTVTLAGAAGVPINFPVDQPAQAAGARISTIEAGVPRGIDEIAYPGSERFSRGDRDTESESDRVNRTLASFRAEPRRR